MKSALVFTALITCLLQGCASVVYTTPLGESLCGGISSNGGGGCPRERNKVYIGVRKDVEAIADSNGGEIVLPIIDLPLSAILDTLFLPYTIIYTIVNRSRR